MFRLTKDGLKAKSEAQLRDLFQRATREISIQSRASVAFKDASIALHLLRAEIAAREPKF